MSTLRVRWLAAAFLLSVSLSCGTVSRLRKGDVRMSDLETASKVASAIEDLNKDLTPENEYYVGRSVGTNILAKHDYDYLNKEEILDGDLAGVTNYVNQVGMILASVATENARDGDRPAPIGGWHFVVVKSDVVNAFAAPGGYVFVTTAALRQAETEDELAAILAHEVAHVVRGHALGTIKKSRYANVSKDLLKASGALSPEQVGQLTELLEGAIDDMVDAFFVKGYSKDTEFEADKVGQQILAQAGYDPAALTRYLETLAEHQDTGSGGFYATHPKAEDRVAKLKASLKSVGGEKKIVAARTERFLAATEDLR